MNNSSNKPAQFASKEFRRPITEILADFATPIPARFLSTRSIKGNKITFVTWTNICKLLEFFAPGYEWEIEMMHGGDRLYVTGTLIIKAAEGDFKRSATGNEIANLDAYGDPSSNAEAMALRRAAAKFGLGRHLWEK